nr:MAG TPA: hypothetical protein [Caudoviricetes sp.]
MLSVFTLISSELSSCDCCHRLSPSFLQNIAF